MREPRAGGDIADGINPFCAGLAPLVGLDAAALDAHTAALQTETFGIGFDPHGDDDALERHALALALHFDDGGDAAGAALE